MSLSYTDTINGLRDALVVVTSITTDLAYTYEHASHSRKLQGVESVLMGLLADFEDRNYLRTRDAMEFATRAAERHIEQTNLRADADRYREIVRNPLLDIEYYDAKMGWRDFKAGSDKSAVPDSMLVDELHREVDATIDQYRVDRMAKEVDDDRR